MIATINAKIKLKNGPAKITEKRAHFPLLLKEFSEVSSSSSPTIAHEPPSGRIFQEYFVTSAHSSVFSKVFCEHKSFTFQPLDVFAIVISLGPIPTLNSGTPIPFFLASRKCPSSCATTITVNINNATIIFIRLPLCLFYQNF